MTILLPVGLVRLIELMSMRAIPLKIVDLSLYKSRAKTYQLIAILPLARIQNVSLIGQKSLGFRLEQFMEQNGFVVFRQRTIFGIA
ncbi:hypothetical protein H8S57_16355 [Lawsonibacter sp. NSJ-51]|uniref:Uncharacterized protein n=1 Tax=Lawsonibacter hominis TaxID=2763053 RepID=A0A8J6JJA1_9FIRM|nr:hypothetical protein [Lawsonibacter hominis]